MRKVLLTIIGALALLSGPKTFAQITNLDGVWSFAGGFTTFSVSGPDSGKLEKLGLPNMLPGFFFGVSIDYPFSSLDGFTLEPGVYIQHYGKTFTFGVSTTPDDKAYHLNYINVPINLKYTFPSDSGYGIAVFTGPRFNLGVGGNMLSTGNTYPGIRNLDAQWGLGVAVTLADAIVVKGGYDLGLTKCLKNNKDLGFDEEVVYHNTFQIGATFLFK